MSESFEIELLEQRWLVEELAEHDLCSHGRLLVRIGGRTLADGSEDYGISETALALLRTLEADHTRCDPVAERLVFHGCGTMLMMGCPIGIDWTVEHQAGSVSLRDAIVHPTVNEADAVLHPDAAARVPLGVYEGRVVGLASAVEEFFGAAAPKVFEDDFDRRQHQDFWHEFRAILERHRSGFGGHSGTAY